MPLKIDVIWFKISITWPWSEMVISHINLRSTILVLIGKPNWFSLIVVNWPLGLCLKVPSLNAETPSNFPVRALHASQYWATWKNLNLSITSSGIPKPYVVFVKMSYTIQTGFWVQLKTKVPSQVPTYNWGLLPVSFVSGPLNCNEYPFSW